MNVILPTPPDRYIVRDQVETRRSIEQAFAAVGSAVQLVTFTNGRIISTGAGDPENVVSARVGSLYLRSDGGAGTAFYVKETGDGNTGWVAK